jgi:uncharacterized protein YndB with AHSA1/START domain
VPEPEAEVGSDVIEREVRIEAPPETVFEFFVDPEKYVRWKGRMAWLDPRPGGEYRVAINDKAVAKGEFVVIDPPRRVVFTWGWEGTDATPPGSSTVEVTLEPDGDATILRLVHRGLTPSEVAQHAHGWDHYLGRLEVAGPGGDPGPDPNAAA